MTPRAATAYGAPGLEVHPCDTAASCPSSRSSRSPFCQLLLAGRAARTREIPLPEHPRPDFERADWVNLNGDWAVPLRQGRRGRARALVRAAPSGSRCASACRSRGARSSPASRTRPTSRGTRGRSGCPRGWKGKRVFLVVGASDWQTTRLARRPAARRAPGRLHALRVRADEARDARAPTSASSCAWTTRRTRSSSRASRATGTRAGIWQTAYLEARPGVHVDAFEFHPTSALKRVEVRVRLPEAAPGRREPRRCACRPGGAATPRRRGAGARRRGRAARRGSRAARRAPRARGRSRTPSSTRSTRDARRRRRRGPREDLLRHAQDLRRERCPGLGHPYVALNGEPVYLQMTLDQASTPTASTTCRRDEAVRDEILIARRLGLNAIRIHVKVELPRKLYWADRLGVLVMADVPNSWGEPDAAMREEWETALRGMIRRDFNHPAVFSWVLFNEQWGLHSNDPERPDEQDGRTCPRRRTGWSRATPGEVARPDAPRRGQLALLRRRPREDRPQHAGTCTCPAGGGRRRSTRPRRRPSPGRRGTTSAGASRARSRCSTASAATCGATRARPATSTGASTITR